MFQRIRLYDAATLIPWESETDMPRVAIDFHAALNFIPRRVFSTFSELYRLRTEPLPVIAWHALENEPSPVPVLVLLAVLLFTLLIYRHIQSLPLVTRQLRKWLADPLGHHHYELQWQRVQDKYRHAVEKLVKVAQRCRALQSQLKEKDERLHGQSLALDSATRDLEYYQAECEHLKEQCQVLTTSNEQLKTEKTTLERQAVEQYYEHARQLHESEREQETLDRVVQFLETEQTTLNFKHETTVQRLEAENDALRQQIAEQSALLVAQRNASSVRVSEMEDRLLASRQANESLQRQFIDQASEQAHQQELLHEQLCTVETKFQQSLHRLQDENASLQQQMADQQDEYTSQRDILLDRLSLATADQSEVKAKLKRVNDDLELKSADLARLAAQASLQGSCCSELHESIAEDLSFVFVESHYQQDMYEGRLASAQAEITALRDQLAKCVKRYERQSSRLLRAQASWNDTSNDHDRLASKVQALEAQKQVSDDLEHMLSEAIHRHEDKYETLEISFDVLESAYSFLASELVRTEHLLKDAVGVQRQLWERLHVYEPDCLPLPEPVSEEEEEMVEEVEDRIKEVEDAAEDVDDTGIETDPDEDADEFRRASASRVSTAMSMSSISDRSWPATPGLSMYSTSTQGPRSPLSSPIVLTPPLPALQLPSKPPTEGCPSAYPSSEADDVFGPWSMLNGRGRG